MAKVGPILAELVVAHMYIYVFNLVFVISIIQPQKYTRSVLLFILSFLVKIFHLI